MKKHHAFTTWIILCVAINQILAYNTYQSDIHDSEDKKEINCSDRRCCSTPECISTAGKLIESIDEKVNPCDDFYKFACGRWIANQLLPPHRSVVTFFDNRDRNLVTVRNLLSEEPRKSELSSVIKAKNLYFSCITHSKDLLQSDYLLKAITDTFGAWPLTQRGWDENNYDLEDILVKAMYIDVHPLAHLRVGARLFVREDGRYDLSYILELSDPELGLPQELYSAANANDVIFSAYEKKILSDARRFGIDSEKMAIKDIQDIIRVEATLAMMLKSTERSNITENTLGDIQTEYGQLLNWTHIITRITSSPEIGITGVTGEEIIRIHKKLYLSEMVAYFTNLPKRVQANYIMWRILDTLENVVLHGYRRQQTSWIQAVYGITSKLQTEECCIKYISRVMELVVHRLLYAGKLPPSEREAILKIFKNIQEEFSTLVEEQDWVDGETATVIQEKIAAVLTRFAFFDNAMNDTFLEHYYSNVTFSRSNLLENILAERKEAFLRNMRLLRKQYQYDVEEMPYESIAMMDVFQNIIDMSATTFDPPAFSSSIPQSLNYGGIGFILGHELLHAFDNEGFKHNKYGHQGDWWSNATAARFVQRYQCMIDQYDAFYNDESGQYVNGTATLAENIADNGGIKIAYRAYRRLVDSLALEELPVPGLPYTHNQLLFINLAQVWCTRSSLDLVRISNEDEHSPARFRYPDTSLYVLEERFRIL